MIKVSVFYPNGEGKKFDMEYYLDKHIPMVREKCGAACRNVAVDQGLSGAESGSGPVYVAMCHLLFDSAEPFQKAFGPHAEEIMADIPNHTDTQPIIQISDVKI